MIIAKREDGEEDLEAEVWKRGQGRDGVGALIAHPHPKFGGSLQNNVVKALYRALVEEESCRMVVRFNFRGVGKSTGTSSWRGNAERKDIALVADFLSRHGEPQSDRNLNGIASETNNSPQDHGEERSGPTSGARLPFVLVGYSFGSAVASGMAEELRALGCVGFVAIAYPVGYSSALLFHSHYRAAAQSTLPKLFLSGAADNFTWTSTLRSWFDSVKEPKDLHIHSAADHFWFGKEAWLVDRLLPWLRDLASA